MPNLSPGTGNGSARRGRNLGCVTQLDQRRSVILHAADEAVFWREPRKDSAEGPRRCAGGTATTKGLNRTMSAPYPMGRLVGMCSSHATCCGGKATSGCQPR